MANVTLPTPVFAAAGGLCLLAGYLLGSLTAPGTSARTTGEVVSYDRASSEICLTGEALRNAEGADSEGTLCGTWRRTQGATVPSKGDEFRFVSVSTTGEPDGQDRRQVVIYGDVVR